MTQETKKNPFLIPPTKNWFEKKQRPEPMIVGDTIPEAYLNSCARLGKDFVCSCDGALGEINYAKSRVITLLIADSVKNIKAERIGIFMPSLAATDHLVFGCIMAKKVPALLNWTLGRASLAHVLKTAELSTVLTSKKVWAAMENVPKDLFEDKLIFLEDILKAGATPWGKIKAFTKSLLPVKTILKLYGHDTTKPDDTALLLFTSGSENYPKGVPLSHRNLLVNADDARVALFVKPSDSVFSILPPFHSYGLTTSLILPTICGARCVHYPNPLDYKTLVQIIDEWKPTILPGTQTFLRGIAKAAQKGQLDSVTKAVSGGERTPKELFDLYEELSPNTILREGYGVTECSPVISVGRYDAPRGEGVGVPFKHVKATIVDVETKKRLGTNQEGLICVSGPSIFQGYLDKTIASPFLEFDGATWYNTGDIGRINEKGEIIISGRLKRFVKIGGEMISLPALEQVLEEKWPPGVSGPSLALQYFEGDGNKPQIVLLTPLELDKTEVNEVLRAGGFSNLARISKVLKVDKIPLQGTGKTDFRALKEIAISLMEE